MPNRRIEADRRQRCAPAPSAHAGRWALQMDRSDKCALRLTSQRTALQPERRRGDVAAPRESVGTGAALIRFRAGIAAALCLVSPDVLADPYGQVFGAIFLGVGLGLLACVVVELAYGGGPWAGRLAIGIAFAALNAIAYLVAIGVLIQLSIASGPSTSETGYGPVAVAILLAWILPAARLWALLRAKNRQR